MRDQRDPEELYNELKHVMFVHGCSISEASDLLESKASGLILTTGADPRPFPRAVYHPSENGAESHDEASRDG